MKVRKGSAYVYRPCRLDRADGRTSLRPGDRVKVIHPHGCPPPNAMGHAHVGTPDKGEFIGLVCTASLHEE